MTASLLFGAFQMVQAAATTTAPWTSKVLTDGTNRGNPVPITVQVQSWLQDGAIVATQDHDNRDVPVKVKLTADSLLNVGAAEKALFAEMEKPNTLSWTPNAALISPVVFVVVTSKLEHLSESGWDNAEVEGRPSAKYQLSLTCESFVRSATETVTAALAATGATTTSLDTMGANTGWTGTVNGISATVTNTVGPPTTNSVTQATAVGAYVLALQKTFAATTTSTKYLMVDWKPSIFGGSVAATGDGVDLPLLAEAPSPTSGYVRSWFYVAASSLAVTKFSWTYNTGVVIVGNEPTLTLALDGMSVTNANPTFGTGRQQIRSLTIGGSARAPASLAIESATAALGNAVLVYTYPSTTETFGYSPALRQFRTSGNSVIADASLVSGSRESLATSGVTWTIPVGLLPAGQYVLLTRMALASSAASGTFTTTLTTVLGSNSVGTVASSSRTIALSTTYTTYTMARFSLPTVDLPVGTPASVQVSLAADSVWLIAVNLDEAWLFNTTIGQLVWVDCGTGAGAVGGAARRLFLEPPTVADPRSTLRIGHSANRSDSFYPVNAVTSWQTPQFPVASAVAKGRVVSTGQVNIMTVTPNATDSTATARYFKRHHTNDTS